MSEHTPKNADLQHGDYGILSSGRRFLVRHVEGGRNTCLQAIKAKCHECCGGFADGRVDCEIETCPLYRWMPYRKSRKGAKARGTA